MALTALKKLISSQITREAEIESMRARLMNKPRDSLNKHIVQASLDAIREILVEIRKTHSDITARDEADTEAYVVDKWIERIQGVYENALDEFLTLLSYFEKAESETSISEAGSDGRVAKLPRIPLPTFSGKYEDWASFSDLFTALVHDIPRLSDATKLQYLKLCLKDSAADLIKDVTTTNANYASTWKALNDRYHNPRLIIYKLLTAFNEIPHMKSESASGMRAFVDEVQRIIRALTNFKIPVQHWDIKLIFELTDRLDSESRRLWEAELTERDRELESIDTVDEQDGPPKSLPKFRFHSLSRRKSSYAQHACS